MNFQILDLVHCNSSHHTFGESFLLPLITSDAFAQYGDGSAMEWNHFSCVGLWEWVPLREGYTTDAVQQQLRGWKIPESFLLQCFPFLYVQGNVCLTELSCLKIHRKYEIIPVFAVYAILNNSTKRCAWFTRVHEIHILWPVLCQTLREVCKSSGFKFWLIRWNVCAWNNVSCF